MHAKEVCLSIRGKCQLLPFFVCFGEGMRWEVNIMKLFLSYHYLIIQQLYFEVLLAN